MRLRRKQLESGCAEIVELVGWVQQMAGLLADRANADVDDGVGGRSYDGDGRGGAEFTAVERRALADRTDPVAVQMAEFLQALDDTRRAARRARRLAGALCRADDPGNQAASVTVSASKSIGAGYCLNCNHYCAGTANDRLRSGRCQACAMYRHRHQGLDRPRELWGTPETEEVA